MTVHSIRNIRKMGVVLAAALASLGQAPARAGCTATSNAPTATCSGDLSGGISLSDIGQTTVEDLTAPIAPPDFNGGISVFNANFFAPPDNEPGQSGLPGSLDYSDLTYGATVVGDTGVEMFSWGQIGGNGSGTPTTGNPGAAGGAGGTATLTISAPSLAAAGVGDPERSATAAEVLSQGGIGAPALSRRSNHPEATQAP